MSEIRANQEDYFRTMGIMDWENDLRMVLDFECEEEILRALEGIKDKFTIGGEIRDHVVRVVYDIIKKYYGHVENDDFEVKSYILHLINNTMSEIRANQEDYFRTMGIMDWKNDLRMVLDFECEEEILRALEGIKDKFTTGGEIRDHVVRVVYDIIKKYYGHVENDDFDVKSYILHLINNK